MTKLTRTKIVNPEDWDFFWRHSPRFVSLLAASFLLIAAIGTSAITIVDGETGSTAFWTPGVSNNSGIMRINRDSANSAYITLSILHGFAGTISCIPTFIPRVLWQKRLSILAFQMGLMCTLADWSAVLDLNGKAGLTTIFATTGTILTLFPLSVLLRVAKRSRYEEESEDGSTTVFGPHDEYKSTVMSDAMSSK